VTVQYLSHIGICVAELERSVRFYCDVLGFTELSRLQVSGAESARLLDITAAFVTAPDKLRIDLLQAPGDPKSVPGS
jgi:glyoxylase I family protein